MSLLIGILDDDKGILFTFRAMASTQNWQVLASTCFDDARQWFADGQLDLLLLDYHMPCMNGMDALKLLKNVNPSIPILMLTVELDSLLANQLLMEGASDFINKPLRLADFVARIRLHERLAVHRETNTWQRNDKGMSIETRNRIVEVLQNRRCPVTIKDIATSTGLAYPTAHRYLDYLYQQKFLSKTAFLESAREGKQGRPTIHYSLIGVKNQSAGGA